MSNWRLADFRGKTEIWCFDLGRIKRFIPNGIPRNEDNPLSSDTGRVETEDGLFIYGYLDKKNIPRIMGYDAIFRVPIVDDSHVITLPDNAEPGLKINAKNFYRNVSYQGRNLHVYCNDPRFLAIINLQWDAQENGVPYKKIKRIFERVPSRESATEYLRQNGFAYGEPLTDREYENLPENLVYATMNKTGDFTPLLNGLK